MRFIIYGAGGIGGTIGARLFQHGYQVLLIARGAHHDAIRDNGLTLRAPEETLVQPIPVVAHPDEIDFQADDVVFLTMKSQHSWNAMLDLRAVAGSAIPIICCQNGVENERMAIRLFQHVYAMLVFLPANHFEPGVVECNAISSSSYGILDTGRYPRGTDDLIVEVAECLERCSFSVKPDDHAMRWKYKKLLMNLGNSLQAVGEINDETADISRQMHEEALAVYKAAGIEWASDDEEKNRRGNLVQMKRIEGQRRAGGSSWQSLANNKGDIESDFLNGEIVTLGRLHNIPTPANHVLQVLAATAAREGQAPGSIATDEIKKLIQEMSDAR
ncbi:MAG: 2-dehydropantoate 2-reductase N-terminal domain-containing protein [bacterium]|nr:ketopantoate reductase family protein [Gammaproteobacteria bacterium]HIL98052.1 ketopantoate reductase family protein [Pseudomonadales bacterium]